MTQEQISHTKERPAFSLPGVPMLFLLVAAFIFGMMLLRAKIEYGVSISAIILITTSSISMAGFYSLQPNEAMAITLFGAYSGTNRKAGLHWIFPWMTRKKISMRVRNITSDKLKVNDKDGNPIEIAANVVWRVTDSAQALFDINDYESFCRIEIDTALRDIAAHYSYDHAADGELTLRGHAEDVAALLGTRLNARLAVGGMVVDEARISHLAYASEIAGAMLKRQQAQAIISARQLIVQGAVSMVEMALKQLAEHEIIELDEERKAQMVSNLLVVLCSDKDTQPIVNTGSVY